MIFLNNYEDFTTTLIKALNEIDPNWESLPGLIIAGSHSAKNIQHKLEVIEEARIKGTPYLGICLGHQLAAIEYARNVLGIKDATSEEFGMSGTLVIKKRPQIKVGLHDGETYWSNYDVAIETKHPAHFITVPYHPEYQSSKEKPHPILIKFLELCKQ